MPHDISSYSAMDPRRHRRRPMIDDKRRKTRLCWNYSSGVQCPFGNACAYAHGPHELRRGRSDPLTPPSSCSPPPPPPPPTHLCAPAWATAGGGRDPPPPHFHHQQQLQQRTANGMPIAAVQTMQRHHASLPADGPAAERRPDSTGRSDTQHADPAVHHAHGPPHRVQRDADFSGQSAGLSCSDSNSSSASNCRPMMGQHNAAKTAKGKVGVGRVDERLVEECRDFLHHHQFPAHRQLDARPAPAPVRQERQLEQLLNSLSIGGGSLLPQGCSALPEAAEMATDDRWNDWAPGGKGEAEDSTPAPSGATWNGGVPLTTPPLRPDVALRMPGMREEEKAGEELTSTGAVLGTIAEIEALGADDGSNARQQLQDDAWGVPKFDGLSRSLHATAM